MSAKAETQEGSSNQTFFLPSLKGENVPVTIYASGNGSRIEVKSRLKDPQSYRGPDAVQTVANYPAPLFATLRGENWRNDYDWTREAMLRRRIVDLSVLDERASNVSSQITTLARGIVSGAQNYSDARFRNRYTNLTQRGYALINENSAYHPFSTDGWVPVILLRAGEKATEFTLGTSPRNGVVRIDEKRGHFIGEEEGDVSLMMNGVNNDELTKLSGANLLICDPAFATGSSLLAVVLAMEKLGVKPSSIELRSIAATRAGLDLTAQILKDRGIDFQACVLAIGGFLNPSYYIGDLYHGPVVADAGDALYGPKTSK